jgi:hypothetical protein
MWLLSKGSRLGRCHVRGWEALRLVSALDGKGVVNGQGAFTVDLTLRSPLSPRSPCPGAASRIKPVSLELGGNSPVVICDDCDLDAAVKGAHEALFFNMVRLGMCVCV